MSFTKIVATIGPKTNNQDSLLKLHKAGMSVARLNGSHADMDWHRKTINLIRETLPNVPILLDIPGRKIRTIKLEFEPSFEFGDTIVLTTDLSHNGKIKVPVNYEGLHIDLKAGDTILADDGTLKFIVEKIEGTDIYCKAQTSGKLCSSKGINVPFVKLNTKLITERDHQMVSFAKELEIDFIGISFVESAGHVKAIRELVNASTPRVLAKIENMGGLENLVEIIQEADAIMIDRGDLSVETDLESIAIYQKRIIKEAVRYGKPVIVATEMLHTMIKNNFPTKAEVVDISNAVLDGCSATMLSGETAMGDFPIESVSLMRRVADACFEQMKQIKKTNSIQFNSQVEGMINAIEVLLRSVHITKVVAITRSGYAARMLSSKIISQPILAVSDDKLTARSLNLLSGVEGYNIAIPFPKGSADHLQAIVKHLYKIKSLKSDDTILVTGVIYPRSGTRMNFIQIHKLSDLIEEFKW
jgi:pyruvate kinase